MEFIAGVACFFFCADKAYGWFCGERKHRMSVKYTDRKLDIDERAVETAIGPMEKTANGVDRISKRRLL
jgi:bisphosphoglycerate-dependent phosphoglycerate mutase